MSFFEEESGANFGDHNLKDVLLAIRFEISTFDNDDLSDIPEDLSIDDDDFPIASKSSLPARNILYDLWRRVKPTTALTGVRKNGEIFTDPSLVHGLISEHWADGFAEQHIDQEAADDILKYSNFFPDDISWQLSFEDFLQVVSGRKDSAPGPDSLPYSAWKNASLSILRVIYDAYCLWLQGTPLPKWFNESLLWILPKGDDPHDSADACVRDLNKTRPLTGSNTLPKIFASCLNFSFCKVLDEFVDNSQAAVKGRSMIDNVNSINAAAVNLSDKNSQVALVLLDFSAAFPSLAREFIFKALAAAHVPENIIRAIRELYKDNDHVFRFGNIMQYSFTALSGVRQGCPLSATIFAIATDSIIRYIKAHLTDIFSVHTVMIMLLS